MIKKWLFVVVLIGGLFSQASFAQTNVDGLLGAVTGCMGEGSSRSPEEVVNCLSNADVTPTEARLVAIAYVLMVPLGSNIDGDCYTTGQLSLAGSLISNAVTFDELGSQISTDLAVKTCDRAQDQTLADLVPGTKKLAKSNSNFANILKTAFKQSFDDDQCLFEQGPSLLKQTGACQTAHKDALAVVQAHGSNVVDALLTFLNNHTDIDTEVCCNSSYEDEGVDRR